MGRLRALLALCLFAAALAADADCIANGHYTIAATADGMNGTRYPYTEDLTDDSRDLPVGSGVVVRFDEHGGWTKLQTGCANSGERNVAASGPVHLQLRASFRIDADPAPVVPPAARYEVQLRLGRSDTDPAPIVAASEIRRIGSRFARSDRFAATIQDVPAGSYVYSMWIRLLDGDASSRFNVSLQWLTAQGTPNVYPSARSVAAADDLVGPAWTAAGQPIAIDNILPIDASLQSTFTVVEAPAGTVLMAGISLDDASSGGRFCVVAAPDPALQPDGFTIFDQMAAIPPGHHTLRVWMRTADGIARLRGVRLEEVGFPRSSIRPPIGSVQDAFDATPMRAEAAGSAEQPPSMSPVCGRWTKLLEFTMEPLSGSVSWLLSGFVEILGSEVSGSGQVGIQVTHREQQKTEPFEWFDAATDMGMFEFQASPGGDGISFYGDASKWGAYNDGAHVSLWIRRIECNGAPAGGAFIVGRRWLSIKLLPSEGRHL
ncbi:MAG TPA: hypothetical protein VEZ11_10120 [Thermoanaerobaculia bacterium]|nr:hypothetical protein [Thermoanaerobaculia bacterium]